MYIHGLADPLNGELRYIGYTLEQRQERRLF